MIIRITGDIYLDGICLQGQAVGQGIGEDVLIGVIGGHIRNGTDKLKGHGIADVPVSHIVISVTIGRLIVRPLRSFILRIFFVRDLLLHGGNIAVLGFHRHVAQHLDNIFGGTIGIAL